MGQRCVQACLKAANTADTVHFYYLLCKTPFVRFTKALHCRSYVNPALRPTSFVVFVVVVITPPLSRDGGTARTAIQVHAVNLIEIRLGERRQPISNQPWMAGSPTTNQADCLRHCCRRYRVTCCFQEAAPYNFGSSSLNFSLTCRASTS